MPRIAALAAALCLGLAAPGPAPARSPYDATALYALSNGRDSAGSAYAYTRDNNAYLAYVYADKAAASARRAIQYNDRSAWFQAYSFADTARNNAVIAYNRTKNSSALHAANELYRGRVAAFNAHAHFRR